MARQWTEEQKARQADLIRLWKPWMRSTGARTPEGKRISSMNVLVGNENRARALAIAKQELKAAEMKVAKLSRGKIDLWINQMNMMMKMTSRKSG